jgi:hypothetical protein
VAALLDELVAGGHRTLVFSQSRVMLDILQVCVRRLLSLLLSVVLLLLLVLLLVLCGC